MYNRFRLYTPVIMLLTLLGAVLSLLALFYNRTLFYISVAVSLAVFAAALFMLRRTGDKIRFMLREIGQGIEGAGNGEFVDFPMPVITVYDGSEIIWYNKPCAERIFKDENVLGKDIADIFPELDVSVKSTSQGCDVAYGEQRFTAFVSRSIKAGRHISVIYLTEDTEIKRDAEEYQNTKPSIALILVDNYEEMLQDFKDGERAQLMNGIEDVIEGYIKANNGFVTRISRDRFIAVIEERGMQHILHNKFDLLDRVRKEFAGDKINATLSIGVGRDAKNLEEAESLAKQALDMCLGRGGDQAAVKTQSGYEFYGGISKGIEKRTKVKTRIIANALAELIESSSNVVVMGHRFADLDCLGAAIGIFKSVREMRKSCAICINREKNLVRPLLDRLLATGYIDSDFVSAEDATGLVNDKTLLIVVDTHVPNVLESEELYRSCKNVVVIDHHRKLVQYIDNAVIFYHEPYASSASEMVAELVQYLPVHPKLTKTEAEVLLAGIMLDTKNFALRTGVRTFEAAAYLRRLGADTVEVRKLFSSTMDFYQQKTNLVSNAEIYRNCAIAVTDFQFDGIKMVAPQAADDLMNIEGVEASFVIFPTDGSINVSARSMGAVNVQVIMEKLGGGGHQTMAAAQFAGESMENVRRIMMEAIDAYHASMARNTDD